MEDPPPPPHWITDKYVVQYKIVKYMECARAKSDTCTVPAQCRIHTNMCTTYVCTYTHTYGCTCQCKAPYRGNSMTKIPVNLAIILTVGKPFHQFIILAYVIVRKIN